MLTVLLKTNVKGNIKMNFVKLLDEKTRIYVSIMVTIKAEISSKQNTTEV
jgi:hypothetical protein